MAATTIKGEVFQSTIDSENRTVLVEFYAQWCGPCKAFAPTLDEFAKEHSNALVTKLDIEEAPELARKFQVRSVPTFIVFKNGEVAHRSSGVPTKQELEEMIS